MDNLALIFVMFDTGIGSEVIICALEKKGTGKENTVIQAVRSDGH